MAVFWFAPDGDMVAGAILASFGFPIKLKPSGLNLTDTVGEPRNEKEPPPHTALVR